MMIKRVKTKLDYHQVLATLDKGHVLRYAEGPRGTLHTERKHFSYERTYYKTR